RSKRPPTAYSAALRARLGQESLKNSLLAPPPVPNSCHAQRAAQWIRLHPDRPASLPWPGGVSAGRAGFDPGSKLAESHRERVSRPLAVAGLPGVYQFCLEYCPGALARPDRLWGLRVRTGVACCAWRPCPAGARQVSGPNGGRVQGPFGLGTLAYAAASGELD